MKYYKFIILCAIVLFLSIAVSYYSCTSDRISLFIACLGTFATCATLYLAFLIFRNYSATAEMQKRQFDIVEVILTSFITQTFWVETSVKQYYCYFNKERMTYLLEGLKSSNDQNRKVITSIQFFEFTVDISSRINHYLFPSELKKKLLSNLPSFFIYSDLKPTDAIIFNVRNEEEKFGTPVFGIDEKLNAEQFISRMETVRNILVEYLNGQLHVNYKINV